MEYQLRGDLHTGSIGDPGERFPTIDFTRRTSVLAYTGARAASDGGIRHEKLKSLVSDRIQHPLAECGGGVESDRLDVDPEDANHG